MSRPRGGVIAGTLPAWTTTSTSGVFTLREAQELRAANTWPRGPVAPTSLTASADNAQLSLSWTAPATTHGAITNYLVEYTSSGGSPQYVLTNSTSTSYTLTGLTNNTQYTVRIAAVNFTAGDYSNAVTGTPISVITLTVTIQGAIGNFGDQLANIGIAPKEVARTDWRVTATTSWGHTYANKQPHGTAIDVSQNHLAYFRPNSLSSGTFLDIYHRPSVSNEPVSLYLWISRAPGPGTWTSNWQIDGYVGGVIKYQALFNWNFTVQAGD